MEYIVTSHTGKVLRIDLPEKSSDKIKVDDVEMDLDVQETRMGYHLLHNGHGIKVDVVQVDPAEKSVTLRIKGLRYTLKVKDKFDELLEKLGMDRLASALVSEIKAPMPGLVLDILVKEGDEIAVDQPVIILEAMKMENVIKSPSATVVKKIAVKKGDSVEKNQILVEFQVS